MAMRDGEECLVRVDDGATPDASLAQPQGSVLHHWTVIAHICSSFSRQLCRTKGLVASPMQAEISQAFFFFSFFLFNEIKLFGDSESFSGFCLFLCMSFYQFFFIFLLLKLLKVYLSLCFVFNLPRLRHLSLVVEDFGEEKNAHT